jgi:hypothetical protein
MHLLKMPPQILRLVLLTLAIVVSYLVARYFLTPATFGQYGWYRGEALVELRSRTPVYAGKQACDECHSEVLQKLAKDSHKTLSCEACHGVSRAHANDPNIPPGRVSVDDPNTKPEKLGGSHCIRCHEANPSRPAWFKQIVVKDHYSGKCTECHLPHQPTQTP